MKAKLFYIFILTISLISCGQSNIIYFDIENQTIIRCEGNLYQFNIENISEGTNSLNDYYHIKKINKKGSSSFSFIKPDANYSVFDFRGIRLITNNFKLKPETKYEITNNSNGDAAQGKLLIKTDKNGKIIYADKTSCTK